MPIIAGRASAAYGSGFGKVLSSGDAYTIAGGFTSLATVTLSTSTSEITFSGIPSNYRHLQLRCLLRFDRAAANDDLKIYFNGDTASNYSNQILFGDGSVGTYGQASMGLIYNYNGLPGATATTNLFGVAVYDLFDYSSVLKYKTLRGFTGSDANGSGAVSLTSGCWQNTTPVNSITVAPRYGSNIVANSQIALYGVK